MKTIYALFEIDGVVRAFEYPAPSIESIVADVQQAFYGEVRLVQYQA